MSSHTSPFPRRARVGSTVYTIAPPVEGVALAAAGSLVVVAMVTASHHAAQFLSRSPLPFSPPCCSALPAATVLGARQGLKASTLPASPQRTLER
uniref:Uncharacterized protein n=1 Tax=Oryza sativa subsp. japonica TaxID=39947 RepID=Q84VK2_ORYSJ|nr:hypothetical protein [Oryza sativa Japonica Group]